ncbi:hypothetical protein ACHAXS_000218 [Conticribra weissflogii]
MAIIGLAIALGVGNKNTQDTINDSVHTQVLSDPERGLNAILADLNGNTVSTLSEGFSSSAFVVNNSLSGNKTVCMPVLELAQMLLNNQNGIKNTVSIKDEEGYVLSMLNMEGDTFLKEDYITMASGKFKFSFIGHRCDGGIYVKGEDDGINHGRLLHKYVDFLKSQNNRELKSNWNKFKDFFTDTVIDGIKYVVIDGVKYYLYDIPIEELEKLIEEGLVELPSYIEISEVLNDGLNWFH